MRASREGAAGAAELGGHDCKSEFAKVEVKQPRRRVRPAPKPGPRIR